MRFRRLGIFRGLVSCLTLPAALADAQSVEPSAEADGLVRVALTLEAQQITVTHYPDLSADDRAHQPLLSGTVGSRVAVGTLEGHRALRFGSLAPVLDTATASGADDEAPPSTVRYELWLLRNAQGWELEARPPGDNDIKTILLTHRNIETSAMMFTASIHATAAEAGQVALRWGQHAWSADFRFDELPRRPPQPRVSGRGQERQPDTDTTAFARRTTLSERNESALVLPDGSRIAMLYGQGVDTEDEDYQHLLTTADGQTVRLIRAAVLRLKTDVSLRFGQTDVPTGNLAPGFAGVYGVWLRRVGQGWRFVFNNEPDSWGTQYNAEFDVAEIDAEYSRGDGAFRPLAVTVFSTGDDRGRIVVHWGPHEWATDFMVGH